MSLSAGLAFLPWLRLAALAGLLALAILQARRRWRAGEAEDQTRRILLTWVGMLAGFAIYFGLFAILVMPILLFQLVAVIALWVATPALVSIVVVDLGAKALQAERTGFWLGAGIIVFVALTFVWLGLFGVGELLFFPGLWLELLVLCSVPAAGAISWWSWLPDRRGDQVSKAFE